MPLPPPSPEIQAALSNVSPGIWSSLRSLCLTAESSGLWAQTGPRVVELLRKIPRDAVPYALEYMASQMPGGVEGGGRAAISNGLHRAANEAARLASQISQGGRSQIAAYLHSIGFGRAVNNPTTPAAATAAATMAAWAANTTVNATLFKAIAVYAERGAIGAAGWYIGAGARWVWGRIAGTGVRVVAGAAAAEVVIGAAVLILVAGVVYTVYQAYNKPPSTARPPPGANSARFGQPIGSRQGAEAGSAPREGYRACLGTLPGMDDQGRGTSCLVFCPPESWTDRVLCSGGGGAGCYSECRREW